MTKRVRQKGGKEEAPTFFTVLPFSLFPSQFLILSAVDTEYVCDT